MNGMKRMMVAAVVGTAGVGAEAQEEKSRVPASGEPPARVEQRVEQSVERAARRVAEARRAEPFWQISTGERLRLSVKQPGESVKATYLGVSSTPAQPALQKQLQLKPGVGLVVDDVQPGSPAEQAGVKEFDILHKLDDQLLINPEQFAVLVRTYDAGAEVKLTVIREGKPQVLTAKLTERDAEPLQLMLDAVPGHPEIGWSDPTVLSVPAPVQAPLRVPVREQSIRIKSPDGKQELSAARVTIENDRHKIALGPKDGRKHLTVTDKDGKVLFEGPLETPADLDKVPAELRQALPEVLLD